MRLLIPKGLDFVKYAESKISKEDKRNAYIRCLKVSARGGSLNMLKYFEDRITYDEKTWLKCMCQCSYGGYRMVKDIAPKTLDVMKWRKRTLEIFKYIESKRFHDVDNNYSYVIDNNRLDIFDYIWKRDSHLWKYYFTKFCKYDNLGMIRRIESEIREKIDWYEHLAYCSGSGSLDVFKHCESKCKYIDWNIHLNNVSKTTNLKMFNYIILRYNQYQKYQNKIDWWKCMLNISRNKKLNRDKHDMRNLSIMFHICESNVKHPDYNIIMINALISRLIDTAEYCERQLISLGIEIDWNRCISSIMQTVDGIKYVESRTLISQDQWNIAIKRSAFLGKLDTLKYIEGKCNVIDWQDIMRSRSISINRRNTVMLRYINTKLT